MQADYRRDMNHNYLILQGEAEVDTASYQVRMLAGNTIEGLLPCTIQGMDNQWFFYYEITSRQSVTVLFENRKLRKEEICLLFTGITDILMNIQRYLLEADHLILDPRYMYMDVDQAAIYFCYLPSYSKEILFSFRELAEYILPKIDHQDQEAVVLGYGIYRRSMEENFNLEQIQQELFRKKEKQSPPKNEIPEAELRKKEELHQEALRSFFEAEEEEDEKHPVYSLAGTILAGLIVVAGIYLAYHNRLLPRTYILAGTGILLILAAIGSWMYYRRRKKELEIPEEHEETEMPKVRKPERKEPKKKEPENEEQEEELWRVEKQEEEYQNTILLGALDKTCHCLVSNIPEFPPIRLEKENILVGKLEQAVDYCIPISIISRLHSKIKSSQNKYYVIDLNSKNGTYVNGKLLEGEKEYELMEGDEVRFADVVFSFK